MTVQELIDALKRLDPELPVVLSYDYGDRCHKQACEEVEFASELKIRKSGYTNTEVVCDSNEDDDEEGARVAVVLSADELEGF